MKFYFGITNLSFVVLASSLSQLSYAGCDLNRDLSAVQNCFRLTETLVGNNENDKQICESASQNVKFETQMVYTCKFINYHYYEGGTFKEVRACGVPSSHQNNQELCYTMDEQKCLKSQYCVFKP